MIQIIQPVKGSHICRCRECLTTYVCDDEDIQGVTFKDGHSFRFIECPVCGAEIFVFDEVSE